MLAEKRQSAYQSGYQSTISSLLDKMGTQQTYDFNTDPVYKDYKKQFSELGAIGAQNAISDTNAMSGGMGSTYANAVAGQQNQQYMATMNNVIPQLYQAAMNKYDAEQNALKSEFGMLSQEESNAYGRYRDQVSDADADRNYYYGKYADSLKNDRWQQQFDYQKSRDEVSDKRWQSEFDYAGQRDSVSDKRWQDKFDYQSERDKVSDDRWQKEFDEDVRRFDLNYALKLANKGKGGRSGGSSKSATGTNDRYEYLNHERNEAINYALSQGATKEEAINYGVQMGNLALNKLIASGDFKGEVTADKYVNGKLVKGDQTKITMAAIAARGGKLTR